MALKDTARESYSKDGKDGNKGKKMEILIFCDILIIM